MRKQSILIIDDEPLVLGVLHRLFYRTYDLHLCSNIDQARKALQANSDIDLVISDYMVGEDSGLRLLNEVRTSHPQAKRMLMSGKFNTEIVANAFNNEIAQRIITKPWINGELVEIVHEILNRSERNPRRFPQPQVTFQGDLTGLSVSDILCLLTSRDKSGILVIQHAKRSDARIYLRSGRIVDAVETGTAGRDTIDSILSRREGTFQFFENNQFTAEHDAIPMDQQIIMI